MMNMMMNDNEDISKRWSHHAAWPPTTPSVSDWIDHHRNFARFRQLFALLGRTGRFGGRTSGAFAWNSSFRLITTDRFCVGSSRWRRNGDALRFAGRLFRRRSFVLCGTRSTWRTLAWSGRCRWFFGRTSRRSTAAAGWWFGAFRFAAGTCAAFRSFGGRSFWTFGVRRGHCFRSFGYRTRRFVDGHIFARCLTTSSSLARRRFGRWSFRIGCHFNFRYESRRGRCAAKCRIYRCHGRTDNLVNDATKSKQTKSISKTDEKKDV